MTWSNKKKYILTRIQRTKDLKETNLTEILASWNVKEANNVNEFSSHLSKENSEKQSHHLASVRVVVHKVKHGFQPGLQDKLHYTEPLSHCFLSPISHCTG